MSFCTQCCINNYLLLPLQPRVNLKPTPRQQRQQQDFQRVTSSSLSFHCCNRRLLFIREVILPYLTGQLIQACTGHRNVNTQKVPVSRCDNHAVAWPYDSSASNSNLLRIWYLFRRLGKVGNVRNADPPFKCWSPKVNCNEDPIIVSASQVILIT